MHILPPILLRKLPSRVSHLSLLAFHFQRHLGQSACEIPHSPTSVYLSSLSPPALTRLFLADAFSKTLRRGVCSISHALSLSYKLWEWPPSFGGSCHGYNTFFPAYWASVHWLKRPYWLTVFSLPDSSILRICSTNTLLTQVLALRSLSECVAPQAPCQHPPHHDRPLWTLCWVLV